MGYYDDVGMYNPSDSGGPAQAGIYNPAPPIQQQPGLSNIQFGPGTIAPVYDPNTGRAPIGTGYIQQDPNNPGYLQTNPDSQGGGSPFYQGTPQGGSGGSGGGGGGGGYSGSGLFNPNYYTGFSGQAPGDFSSYLSRFPMPTLPQFHGPNYTPPPAFSYGDFKAPTLDEAKNQPGYQFGVDEGLKALQQSAAAKGLLRTGGTLKDVQQYGQNAATQNYGNVLQQDLGIYNTNRNNAVQTYNTNYQTQFQDPYKANFAEAQAEYAPQLLQYQTGTQNALNEAEFGYNSDWAKYLNQQDVFYNNQNAPFQKYLSLAQLGAANA